MVCCESCGTEAMEGDAYCRQCGEELPDVEAFTCECGAEVLPNDNFCHHCGAAFTGVDESSDDDSDEYEDNEDRYVPGMSESENTHNSESNSNEEQNHTQQTGF